MGREWKEEMSESKWVMFHWMWMPQEHEKENQVRANCEIISNANEIDMADQLSKRRNFVIVIQLQYIDNFLDSREFIFALFLVAGLTIIGALAFTFLKKFCFSYFEN